MGSTRKSGLAANLLSILAVIFSSLALIQTQNLNREKFNIELDQYNDKISSPFGDGEIYLAGNIKKLDSIMTSEGAFKIGGWGDCVGENKYLIIAPVKLVLSNTGNKDLTITEFQLKLNTNRIQIIRVQREV